jgi:murein L,D-transpeptidase YafK
VSASSLGARGLLAAGAVAVAAAMAGCQMDGVDYSSRAMRPLSASMGAELERRHMPRESPILVRLFKEESEFEVWKQDDTGHFALLATYPICRWSGELGPKIKEGDRQAPEGFYTITPGQLNPNSHYYLAFDIGYPNAFDRAHGRTGGNLMVHGDCSSRGCYAMTDEQIGEIYALARESFLGGQRSFQVQAYPFRMTALNLAKHRNNPNMPFWRMLKEGNDHFEVTRIEPKVDICEKRYVFDVEPVGGGGRTAFSPAGKCPAYRITPEIAEALKGKQAQDEIQTADLIMRGTSTVPVRTGMDGGMNPVFLAKYRTTLVREADGTVRTYVEARAPGSVPAANEPVTTETVLQAPAASYGLAGAESKPVASTSATSSPGIFARLFGTSDAAQPAPAAAAAAPPTTAANTKPNRPPHSTVAAAKPHKPEPKHEAQAQSAHPAQPAAAEQPAPVPEKAAVASNSLGSVIAGAQPVVPAGSFESRWSGLR